jgi:hypothetical protein
VGHSAEQPKFLGALKSVVDCFFGSNPRANPILNPSLAELHATAAEMTSGSTLEELERNYILRIFRETGGVVSATATRLGVPRTTERDDEEAGDLPQRPLKVLDRCSLVLDQVALGRFVRGGCRRTTMPAAEQAVRSRPGVAITQSLNRHYRTITDPIYRRSTTIQCFPVLVNCIRRCANAHRHER